VSEWASDNTPHQRSDHPHVHHIQNRLRTSPAVLGMQPSTTSFFTSKFSYLLFCNPTHKTETGIVNRWGTTNSKPPGPIIMIHQSEALRSSQVLFITLFCSGAQRCFGPFTSHGKLYNCAEPKRFCWAKPAYFDFSSSNFTVQYHLGTTAGDALSYVFLILWNLDWFLFATVFL
jgi:hypothetical protein